MVRPWRYARFGPFLFDLQTGELRRKSRKILLQPQPAQLLALLIERAGDLVTIQEIRGALWPDHQHGEFDHSAGVAIKKLRDALGDDATQPLFIETLRRRGYRFVAQVKFESTSAVESRPNLFIGRHPELEELQASFEKALEKERSVVLLLGEAGIGKTALVNEFVRRAAVMSPHTHLCRGQCVDGLAGRDAYSPILDAIGNLCRGPEGDAIIDILSSVAPSWLAHFPTLVRRPHWERVQRMASNPTTERTLRELEGALEAITARWPLILLLEDLQWSDDSTLQLLAGLAHQKAPARLMIVATMRPFDGAPNEQALRVLHQDLLIHHLARQIDLPPLTEAQIAEYLSSASPRSTVPHGLAEFVYRQSEGNPLFITAILEHLQQRRIVGLEESGWRVLQSLDAVSLEIPERLKALLELAIARLSAEEQTALETASVAGLSFSSLECAAIENIGAARFEEICEQVSRRHGIVRPVAFWRYPDGSVSNAYQFTHALYRRAIYQRLTPSRRSLLHQQLAERLHDLFAGELETVAMRLADHFEQAFVWSRALTYLRIAASSTSRATTEVVQILKRALTLVPRLPNDMRLTVEIELLESLGDVYLGMADPRAVDVFDTLIARASAEGKRELEVRTLIRLAFSFAWISTTKCLETIDRALELSLSLDDAVMRAALRARCFALRILAALWNPRDRAEFQREWTRVRSAGDANLLDTHWIDYASVELSSSYYRAAHAAALNGTASLTANNVPLHTNTSAWCAEIYTVWSLLFLGEWGEALREIENGVNRARRNGNQPREWSYGVFRAWLHVLAFDHAGALSQCNSLMPDLRNARVTVFYRLARILAGAAEAGRGNIDGATEFLFSTRQEMLQQPVARDTSWQLVLGWVLGELWYRTGDRSRSHPQAEEFLAATALAPDRTWRALAWDLNARIALDDADLSHARLCVTKAFESMDDFETPLAAWRVDATAADLCDREGNRELSELHRERSCAGVLRLANSLSGHEELQRTFVCAPEIRHILGTNEEFF
jgi:DNA-binding winged helix-turn-helix (wHTH) protein